jgi:regulator of nucleoside diphosphate kinase
MARQTWSFPMSNPTTDLPPITLNTADSERLMRLTEVARRRFPQAAAFLAREVERANVVDSWETLPGLVTMGSEVEFRDDTTGQVRRVRLVYPHEADVTAGKISVLTPIGAALIGLSVSQSIEWETVLGERRSLTVLRVDPFPPVGNDRLVLANPSKP